MKRRIEKGRFASKTPPSDYGILYPKIRLALERGRVEDVSAMVRLEDVNMDNSTWLSAFDYDIENYYAMWHRIDNPYEIPDPPSHKLEIPFEDATISNPITYHGRLRLIAKFHREKRRGFEEFYRYWYPMQVTEFCPGTQLFDRNYYSLLPENIHTKYFCMNENGVLFGRRDYLIAEHIGQPLLWFEHLTNNVVNRFFGADE